MICEKIHEFKKVKNVLFICLFIIVFKILDIFIGNFLYYYSYFDQPDMHSLVWNDFYKYDENSIDVLFVGSSHARFAFDTRTYDKNLEAKTFNLSSSGQTPVIGYYALKEALKYQKPKLVVYETYWNVFGTKDNITPAYFVYDYINGFDTKVEMLSSIYGEQNFDSFLLQSISKMYKYREGIKPAFSNILKADFVKDSNCYSGNVKYEYFTYYTNGFFGSDRVASNEKLFITNPFLKAGTRLKMDNKQIEYFKKSIELCQSNDIKILLVTAPLPKPTMDLIKYYNEAHNVFMEIADNLGVPYIDYNKQNIENYIFKNNQFYDSNHLNIQGTEALNKLLTPEIEKYLE